MTLMLKYLLTVLVCECEVMIEKLSELHDHVGEAGVGNVVVGVILLRDPSIMYTVPQ